jgi:hypothetical protein
MIGRRDTDVRKSYSTRQTTLRLSMLSRLIEKGNRIRQLDPAIGSSAQ